MAYPAPGRGSSGRQRARVALLLGLVLLLPACAGLSNAQRVRAQAVAVEAQSTEATCGTPGHCATTSPLRRLASEAFASSTPDAPRHYAVLLDRGDNALLARLDLLRSATTSIDVQTYIFDEDDAGLLFLQELLAAARRGVRVRLLIDQLAAMRHVDTLAAMAAAHVNLEVRLYNPVMDKGRLGYPEYVLAAACCWNDLNQRMHTKLLLADGAVGISGGRNYQNDYYDWGEDYNFRDRDVLVAGPVAREMRSDFDLFWNDRRSVPVAQLDDVGRRLLDDGAPPLPVPVYERPERVEAMRALVADPAAVEARVARRAFPVGEVRYLSDTPEKHSGLVGAGTSRSLRELIESAQDEVLMQTPYLVLSPSAQDMFRQMHERPDAPRIVVSTNSLAATDAFIVYALSHKYKRRYLREFGFHIYEYKPFPKDAPIDVGGLGAIGAADDAPPADGVTRDDLARVDVADADATAEVHRDLRQRYDRRSVVGRAQYQRALSREYRALRFASQSANAPVPLEREGPRTGLHAKSLVIDGRIGVVGTHNFDPRGDHYNTEAAVVIEDEAFARALGDSIRRDIKPANSWTIARRDKPPVFSGLDYSLGKTFEYLPIFDLWPWRYATSYEFMPGPACPHPLPQDDPGFRACYQPVGDFPEVDLGLKGLTTRIFTAFGAGLAPIL
ncbi:phospholipase D family protein [Marilutibacter spongiae]|uniref:Phospholipase D family protein n=1 Tax=Marilutibacter spongiae TaxID=2025720 RepID=A0A7W3TPE3_9GAMM|nr:phospholipase D family protein [Lysobacter spongiae]MBB1062035.1 phospholipase D family protein [Lysobacter spongiae]